MLTFASSISALLKDSEDLFASDVDDELSEPQILALLADAECMFTNYTPRNEVRGGILESPRPSVCPSVDAWLGKMVTCA